MLDCLSKKGLNGSEKSMKMILKEQRCGNWGQIYLDNEGKWKWQRRPAGTNLSHYRRSRCSYSVSLQTPGSVFLLLLSSPAARRHPELDPAGPENGRMDICSSCGESSAVAPCLWLVSETKCTELFVGRITEKLLLVFSWSPHSGPTDKQTKYWSRYQCFHWYWFGSGSTLNSPPTRLVYFNTKRVFKVKGPVRGLSFLCYCSNVMEGYLYISCDA